MDEQRKLNYYELYVLLFISLRICKYITFPFLAPSERLYKYSVRNDTQSDNG